MMLDEPTTGIDTVSRKELIDVLKLLNKDFGTTIIISSPYRNEIMMSDKAALIEDGRIVRVGTPSEILPSEKVMICDVSEQIGEENVIEVLPTPPFWFVVAMIFAKMVSSCGWGWGEDAAGANPCPTDLFRPVFVYQLSSVLFQPFDPDFVIRHPFSDLCPELFGVVEIQ